jgi:hypothetical protein
MKKISVLIAIGMIVAVMGGVVAYKTDVSAFEG